MYCSIIDLKSYALIFSKIMELLKLSAMNYSAYVPNDKNFMITLDF